VARLILATGDSGLERIGERRDGHKQAMARYRPAHAAPARDGETEDMLPTRRMQWPPTLHRVNRRPFGVGPVPLLSAGLGAAAILAIILFALGSWVAGVVVLACGLGCLALLLVAVEHEPTIRRRDLPSAQPSEPGRRRGSLASPPAPGHGLGSWCFG
jgi:hypothetical protein